MMLRAVIYLYTDKMRGQLDILGGGLKLVSINGNLDL